MTTEANELEQIEQVLAGTQESTPATIEEDVELVESETESAVVEEEEVQVDYEMMVPMVNGEPLSIGQLKDAYQASQRFDAAIIERENSIMKQLDELSNLSQYLDVVPPEVKERAVAEMKQVVRDEFNLMIDAIPQWKDAVEFSKGKNAVYELAQEYGIEKDLGKVTNHKVIKLLYDFARIKEGIAAAKELKPQANTNASGGKPKVAMTKAQQEQQLINKARQSGKGNDEVAAINNLLRI